jgi:hypothetical protein
MDGPELRRGLESKEIIGDDEQYAATMALLANAVGVPARVSLDGTVEADGTVYGKDVRADVELQLNGYGWVTLPASAFTGTKHPELKQQVKPPAQPVKVVPPRRADVIELATDVGIPVLVLAAIAGTLVGAKALRRRRRRGTGPPAARVAGAWRELVDFGRDLGVEPTAAATEAPGGTGRRTSCSLVVQVRLEPQHALPAAAGLQRMVPLGELVHHLGAPRRRWARSRWRATRLTRRRAHRPDQRLRGHRTRGELA